MTDEVIVKNFNPSQQLITFCKLREISIEKIRLRIKFLQESNQRIKKLLTFVDTTIDRGLSFLTDLFFSIRPLIFFETKSEIFIQILEKSKVGAVGQRMKLDRLTATKMAQEKKMDTKLKQYVVCET